MSGTGNTIAILAHANDGFWGQPRLVHLLMARWQEMGLKSELVTDPAVAIPADIALLHVSLSVVPEAYQGLAGRYPRTLNGAVVDIRKRRFSRLLVDRDDPHAGPVIVKTDWNAGGSRELRGSSRWRARIEAARPWRTRRSLRSEAYPVYASADLVPSGVWGNPNLVVERFVAERQGDRYLCRHWLFLGTKEVSRRTVSPDPVVKFRGVMERTSDPVPADLRRIRAELGFDYGKFDYGIVDGEVVLYDVNRTPGADADPRAHAETIEALAPGIRDFLP
jgi:hypothetical protein